MNINHQTPKTHYYQLKFIRQKNDWASFTNKILCKNGYDRIIFVYLDIIIFCK